MNTIENGLSLVRVTENDEACTIEARSHSVAVATGKNSTANNKGIRAVSLSTNTGTVSMAEGYASTAMCIGKQSYARACAGSSVAITTHAYSAAEVTSANSIAIATGPSSDVKGAIGSWLVLVEYDENRNGIIGCKAVRVDGETIKPDKSYILHNGKVIPRR